MTATRNTKGQNPFPEKIHFDDAGILGGKRHIKLTEPFPVVTSCGCYVIPLGFTCDGASIPRLAQVIIGHPFDEYLEDAVNHDFLYRRISNYLGYDRETADDILTETMWNRDLPLWKIAAFHAAVRTGGWLSYKKH